MAATLQPAAQRAGKMNTSQAKVIDKNKQVNIYVFDDLSRRR